MKYNININQLAIQQLDLKMDLVDCSVLDYCRCFAMNDGIKTKEFEGKRYYWFDYATLIENMPLLGITTKNGLWRRFKKLCDLGVMIAHPDNQTDGESYYAFGAVCQKIFFFDPSTY